MPEPKQYQLATQAVHAGQSVDPATNSRAVPIYQTTSYLFNDADHAGRLFALQEFGNIYTRIMNPTTDVFEKRVAALEGGAAGLATASGQAAETLTILTLASAGEEIVSTTSLYGGTYNLFHYTLPKLGIMVRFVDADDFDGLRAAINYEDPRRLHRDAGQSQARRRGYRKACRHRARAQAAADHRQHLRVAGAGAAHRMGRGHRGELGHQVPRRPRHRHRRRDCGRGQVRLGGLGPLQGIHGARSLVSRPAYTEAFGPLAFILKARVQGLRDTGAALSPFNSFLLLQGIETLHLRMERHSQNALAVARHLEQHPGVEWVNYPGLESSRYARAQKSICPRARARWSHLALRAATMRERS